MTNSAAPDQLASEEANWSRATLFAKAGYPGSSGLRLSGIDIPILSKLFYLFPKKGSSLKEKNRGGSNEYPQSMFWADMWKLPEFFIWKFSFFGGKILNIFE